MKYIKLFENHTEYEDFVSGDTMAKPNVSHCVSENEVHYNPIIHDYSKDYLTFVAIQDDTKISFRGGAISTFELSYSLDDGSTWNVLGEDAITLNKGEKVLWKGYATPTRGSHSYKIGRFVSLGYFNAMGNIMSLAYSDDFIGNNQLPGNMGTYFGGVFEGSGIISAENLILPATTLADYCYSDMFQDCVNLTTAPELPATTLVEHCYYEMFKGCTSLTTAPELPATTLANNCYQYMFSNCTSLTTEAIVPDNVDKPISSSYCAYMYCSCPITTHNGNYNKIAYQCYGVE